uniref:Malectin-B-like n=2 Tax=Hirondellea gigas TaxID=1518452 RepID=A0A6A7G157_9CRUS
MQHFTYTFILLVLSTSIGFCNAHGEVIYAVNAGGDSHTDVHGVQYVSDPLLAEDVGTASDFGRGLVIARVPPADQVLYQTERYHDSTFGYNLPLRGDGDYVLVLMFAEVYFNAPDQKVFNVELNGAVVLAELDIFSRVGRGVAHLEIVPFRVKEGRVVVLEDGTQVNLLHHHSLRLDFVKGYRDNPKINAIYLIRGTVHDVPQLPPLPLEEPEPLVEEEPRPPTTGNVKTVTSGPRTTDPYSSDDSTGTFLPLLAAVGAAIPIVFCLCRM